MSEYTAYNAIVRRWSTIHFGRRTCRFPSQLIGKEVEVRQHADLIEVYLNTKAHRAHAALAWCYAHAARGIQHLFYARCVTERRTGAALPDRVAGW